MEAALNKLLNQFINIIEEHYSINQINLPIISIAIDCCEKHIIDIRKVFGIYNFDSTNAEVKFFKYQKPVIYGHLKYYLHIQSYLIYKGSGSITQQRQLVDNNIKKLKKGLKPFAEFVTYCKQGRSELDEYYYLRKNKSLWPITYRSACIYDPDFSTSHDELRAEIVAYDLIMKFYEKELETLRIKELNAYVVDSSNENKFNLEWTSNKIDLVELIYALQTSRAIQNGKISITTLANVFGTVFNTDLSNIHRTYVELKSRKKDRCKFMKYLMVALENRVITEES